MNPVESGPEKPVSQDLVAFAKEYFKAYMETIEDKKPQTLPKLAQDAPYAMNAFLLPNGCICMVFNSSKEQSVQGASRDWDEVQDMIVKGVDHFAGFYPFEAKSVEDWNQRGRKDALRDLRLMDRSDLARAGAELESVMENIMKMVKANPWLGKMGNEMISVLKTLDNRVKGGFPTVDAIASLQSLKSFVPGSDKMSIEFPDREILERILSGVQEVSGVQNRFDMIESRMFELEKSGQAPEVSDKVMDLSERTDRLEKQLEKVSNILTMMNSKVESYFSKTAEKERQSELEKKLQEFTQRAETYEGKIEALEKEAENLLSEMKDMTTKMEKDIHDSRKRIARVEKHFTDFAKLVQE